MVDLIAAGTSTFIGGQDSSKAPDQIEDSKFASAINVSTKRGVLQPRWGFERKNLIFPTETVLGPYNKRRTYKDIFESSKFQAMIPDYVETKQLLILVIGGQIFAINLNTFEVKPIPIQDGSTLNTRATRINWSVAGRYLVIYDFPAFPVIIDNDLAARRANPNNMEVPASSQGAFNQNRLFVANNGSEFTGGDPVGSLAAPDAPITFQEVFTDASAYYGQIFQLPTADHDDAITYMGFLQVTDNSTGIGPLIVASERAVYSFNTQNPRSNWEQGAFGSIICYNAGIAGPRAFANTNSDAFFLSPDGYVRSLAMSRDEQKSWARVPISREVEKWFKYWDTDLIKLGFVSYFKNKLFFSVNPYRVAAKDYETLYPISDYAHGGLVVMELDNISAYGNVGAPAWAGLWTGVRPLDMCNVGNQAFVMSKDDGGVNRLYEVNPEIHYDTADDNIRLVRSKIQTKEYSFEDSFLLKELHSVDVNAEELTGDFKLEINYKPGHGPCFLPWNCFSHYAPWRTTQIPEGQFINGFAPHQIRDITLSAPSSDDCSPITFDFYRVCKKVQLELIVTGMYWEIHEVRIKAVPKPQSNQYEVCNKLPIVPIPACADTDWEVEPFAGCDKPTT